MIDCRSLKAGGKNIYCIHENHPFGLKDFNGEDV